MAKEVAFQGQMLDLTFGGSGGLPPERLKERSLTQWSMAETRDCEPKNKVSLPSPRQIVSRCLTIGQTLVTGIGRGARLFAKINR